MIDNNKYFNIKSSSSGIAYHRPIRNYPNSSYRTGDDRWQELNNPYPDAPDNPLYAQDGGGGWNTLKYDNVFGNKNRFTSTTGGTPNGAVEGVIIDHLTGFMWDYTEYAGSWDTAIDNSMSSTTAGYTDWRLPTLNEMLTLWNAGKQNYNAVQIYLEGAYTERFWTSTSRPSPNTYAYSCIYTSVAATIKTGAWKYYRVRTHY